MSESKNMAHLKFLILATNLLFVRFTLATTPEKQLVDLTLDQPAQDSITPTGQASVLNQLNSLDFSPNQETFIAIAPKEVESQPGSAAINQASVNEQSTPSLAAADHLTKGASQDSERTGKSVTEDGATNNKSKRKLKHAAANSSPPSVGQILVGLLGQLEKMDVKRMITDSLANLKADATIGGNKSTSNGKFQTIQKRSNGGNITTEQSHVSSNKGRVNASALGAETGNLLSITKQLVRLARSQMIGGEYMPPSAHYGAGGSSSWPALMPSMLSAASNMFHDSTNDFTGASLKSDWFWMVVPAVIIIGAGVIVIPLIAAWLVSSVMNQNTFTVSAGRRRKRRDISDQEKLGPFSSNSLHGDLFKMLDIHKFLEDSPHLLVNKLSQLHNALESVGSSLVDSTSKLNTKRFDYQQDSTDDGGNTSASDRKKVKSNNKTQL